MKARNLCLQLGASLFALCLSSSVSATSMITESLYGAVASGPYAGVTGTGTFSYDHDLLTGTGSEELGPDDFVLAFTIFGQTFAATDDIAYPDYAVLGFVDGTPTYLDFIISGIIDYPGVTGFSIFDLTPGSNGGFDTQVFVDKSSVVPVPASLWLLGSGLLGLVGVARRKK